MEEVHPAGGRGELVEVTGDTYRRALGQIDHDAYHLPAYVQLQARLSGGRAVAYCHQDADRWFALPLVLDRVPGTPHALTDAASPYGYPGPVASPGAGPTFWRAAVRGLGRALSGADVVSCFVRTHPLLVPDAEALSGAGTVVRHGSTVWLDTTVDEDTARGRLRSNHRRQIDRARRGGLRTVIDDWSGLGAFIDAYHQTMRRVGAGDIYHFDAGYFAALRDALGDHVHLALVVDGQDGDEVLGGGLFFAHRQLVQYHLGATRDQCLPRQPAKLMMDDMRRWASAGGYTAMHLGGGLGGSEADSLFHFKAGFGPGRSPYLTWRVVPDRERYAALAGHGPAADDDRWFFPAYRRSGGQP